MCLYGLHWLDFMSKMIVYYAVVTLHASVKLLFSVRQFLWPLHPVESASSALSLSPCCSDCLVSDERGLNLSYLDRKRLSDRKAYISLPAWRQKTERENKKTQREEYRVEKCVSAEGFFFFFKSNPVKAFWLRKTSV